MKLGDRFQMVQGRCACGHVGPQRRPDICGPCLREQTRETTDNARQAARDRAMRAHIGRCIDRLIENLPDSSNEQRDRLKQALDNLQ